MKVYTLWKENNVRRTKVAFIAGYWLAVKRAKELSLLTSKRIIIVTGKVVKKIVTGGKCG